MKQFLFLVPILTNSTLAKPLIIAAHRGASAYEPENSLAAFERAIAMGAPMIELDVHICKTGQIVVIHDQTITIDNKKRKIEEMAWNILKKQIIGKNEHIPLLEDVFNLVDKRAIINIELKGAGTAKPVADLINHYIAKKQWSADHFIASSFDHYRLLEFKKYSPKIKTGVLLECNPIGHAQIADRANAHYAFCHYQWLTKEFIDDAHKRAIQVFAYTINDKKLANQLQKLGVDGIFTDYPDLLTKKD